MLISTVAHLQGTLLGAPLGAPLGARPLIIWRDDSARCCCHRLTLSDRLAPQKRGLQVQRDKVSQRIQAFSLLY